MLGLWLDYSEGRPSGAALKAAGVAGVMRYVGIGGSSTLPAKRLTAAELVDLTGHGLIVLGAVESSTTRSNAGRAAGVADGKAALADPVTKTLPVLFATNDQPAWSQANVDYVAGFQSIVGRARTGVYGFGAFLSACHAAGLGTVYWQAGPAPSRTGTAALVHFWQRQGGAVQAGDGPTAPTVISVAGVPCDPDNQLKELPTMTSPSPIDKLTDDDVALLKGVIQRYAPGNTGGQANEAGDMANKIFGLSTSAQVAALAATLGAIKVSTDALPGELSAVQAAVLGALPAAGQPITDDQVQTLAGLLGPDLVAALAGVHFSGTITPGAS